MRRTTFEKNPCDDVFDNPLNLVPSDLRHLIPGFLERREKEVRELSEHLANRDFVAIGDIAHRLKGMGAGYGFQLVTDIGAEMELAAVNKNVEKIKKEIDQLSAVTNNLKGILKLHEST